MEIIDDVIAEDLLESFSIDISVSHEQRALFETGNNAMVSIMITDNDSELFYISTYAKDTQ